MTVITVAQAREGLVKAIAERGADYVYERVVNKDGFGTCKYVETDEDGNDCPSCIVGYVVNFIDPALFAILAEEEAEKGGVSAAEISSLVFEEDARWALQAAQTRQDDERTWGEALEAFDRSIAGEIEKYQ